MRGEDLRIGNYFYSNNFKTYDDVLIVRSVFKNKATVYSEKQNLEFNVSINPELKPIPLTKEWLLKLGFTQDGDEYSKDRFTVRFHQRSLIIEGFEYDYNGILIGTENFHVHDLQNIYFAIKKEGLLIINTKETKS